MPDFQRVSAPVFTPTSCVTCLSHRDSHGFIDTGVEKIEGHIYICATCLYQMGRRMGMLNPEQSTQLTHRLAEATAQLVEMQKALEHEKQNKTISFADAKKLLKAGA